MRVPVFTDALGSTEIARVHWEAMAAAAALREHLFAAESLPPTGAAAETALE
jgi:hypothetical protein